MFGFFAALFGGTYLLGKYSADKARSNRYKKEYDDRLKLATQFYNRYQFTIADTISVENMVCKSAPEILELRNELCEIINMIPTNPMLIWGYISRYGKIPHRVRSSRYNGNNPLSIQHENIWNRTPPWEQYTVHEMRCARLKFLIWYDAELRSNGMNERLMFIPPYYEQIGSGNSERQEIYYRESNALPIGECKNLSMPEGIPYPATTLWLPAAIDVPKVLHL